jgi:LmbE family N-acetylglucosaminyl deacetylase
MANDAWTTATRVVAFIAHPDDEFFMSGLLMMTAQKGGS